MDEVSEWIKAGWYLAFCHNDHDGQVVAYASRTPADRDTWVTAHLAEFPGHEVESAQGEEGS